MEKQTKEQELEKERIYEILICPKCKIQLSVDSMGKRCFNCQEWQYEHLSKRIVILPEGRNQAISKFKEKLKERIHKECPNERSLYNNCWCDVLDIIEKTAQEIN
jgi:uncharacterized protein YbaR (Trm112 family)